MFTHTMPSALRAGDGFSWAASSTEYFPADGWVLEYALVQQGARHLVTAAEDGAGWAVAVGASGSAAWETGDYKWVAYVKRDDDRRTLAQGTVAILPDLAAASGGYDIRSTPVVLLEAVEAVLRGVATHAQQEKQVSTSSGSMALKYVPRGELLKMRADLMAEVAHEREEERLNNGQGGARRIQARIMR